MSADTAISYTSLDLDKNIDSHRAARPFYLSGTFVADDTDYHVAKILANGKGRMTFAVDNPANKTVTVTLYGAHSITDEVGDTGVFAIDSTGFAVTAATVGYETNNDVFPVYLVRLKFADTPTDSPSKEVTLYISFSAY